MADKLDAEDSRKMSIARLLASLAAAWWLAGCAGFGEGVTRALLADQATVAQALCWAISADWQGLPDEQQICDTDSPTFASGLDNDDFAFITAGQMARTIRTACSGGPS